MRQVVVFSLFTARLHSVMPVLMVPSPPDRTAETRAEDSSVLYRLLILQGEQRETATDQSAQEVNVVTELFSMEVVQV